MWRYVYEAVGELGKADQLEAIRKGKEHHLSDAF